MIATEARDDVYLIEHEPKRPRSFGPFAPNEMLVLTFDGGHGKQERERERERERGKGTAYAR